MPQQTPLIDIPQNVTELMVRKYFHLRNDQHHVFMCAGIGKSWAIIAIICVCVGGCGGFLARRKVLCQFLSIPHSRVRIRFTDRISEVETIVMVCRAISFDGHGLVKVCVTEMAE